MAHQDHWPEISRAVAPKLSDYQLKGFALLYYAPKDFLGFMEPLCQCGRGSLLEGLLVKKKNSRHGPATATWDGAAALDFGRPRRDLVWI
jgi:hypothetical protein